MNKPPIESIGTRDAADVLTARAGATQLPHLPVAVNFVTKDLLGKDFTFALTLNQAGELLESLKVACQLAIQLYGIPAELLKDMEIKNDGN
jgi:hypothetical protein